VALTIDAQRLSASGSGPLILLALALAGGGAGLAFTNPDLHAFEEFAAAKLSDLITEELCTEQGLPMMLRLVIRDCPGLIATQRPVLGRIAAEHTRRRNFALFSLYATDLGGQQLLPSLRLPRYSAVTLAAAGRFVLLHTEERDPDAPPAGPDTSTGPRSRASDRIATP